ncbi:MAG: hypothetical protein HQK49_19785 [Oligoflexia bacterium]|nr:hypothetical protein [Oligoflexia bacterium]
MKRLFSSITLLSLIISISTGCQNNPEIMNPIKIPTDLRYNTHEKHLEFDVTSYNFGSIEVGAQSSNKQITLKYYGTDYIDECKVPYILGADSIHFRIHHTNCQEVLSTVNNSCSIYVQAVPQNDVDNPGIGVKNVTLVFECEGEVMLSTKSNLSFTGI